MWVQVRPFFGQKVMNAFANNGDFAVNSLDNMAGSGDLISIRGRATSQRPFTTVEALKRSADERFRAKEQELQKQLHDTERKLTELQSAKSQDQAQILSPEQKSELDSFLKQQARDPQAAAPGAPPARRRDRIARHEIEARQHRADAAARHVCRARVRMVAQSQRRRAAMGDAA